MARKKRSLPLKSAQRIQNMCELHNVDKQDLSMRCDMEPTWLSKITGKSKLTEDAYRPMPNVMAVAMLAAEFGVTTDWLLGLEDRISPVAESLPREMNDLVQVVLDEAVALAKRRSALSGNGLMVENFTDWWRQTGGLVGNGGSFDEHVSVVSIPDPTSNVIQPVHVGAKSFTCAEIGGADPDLLAQTINEKFSATTRDSLVRALIDVDQRKQYSLSDMKADVLQSDGTVVEKSWWSIRLPGRLASSPDVPAAVSFCWR